MNDLTALTERLRQLTQLLLDTDLDQLERQATLLAARGYPSSVGGLGGNSELTSVEAAVDRPGRWTDVDVTLARWTAVMAALATGGHRLITDVIAHADPVTPQTRQPAGVGWCLVCDRYCAGGHDRLRAGWCQACTESYRRWRTSHPDGDRSGFTLWRQRRLTADTSHRRSA